MQNFATCTINTLDANKTATATFTLDQHFPLTFTTDGHGILIGNTSQNIIYDGSTTAVSASPSSNAVGVMIARGDLAVECGYERLAEVQEEILSLCEAAHIPVIWATQVLDTLAKSGVPSRAEITDAAMGERAECVMLNKGPHIIAAIRVLDNILQRMSDHQLKKSSMMRQLRWWENVHVKTEATEKISLG